MGIRVLKPRKPAGPRPGSEIPHYFKDDGRSDCAYCGEGVLHRNHARNQAGDQVRVTVKDDRAPMVGPKEPVAPVTVTLAGGSRVEIIESEGWLYIRALDGVLTVRPLNECEIYVRPVGRSGGWIPSAHPARGL